jgi:hypothetical protein
MMVRWPTRSAPGKSVLSAAKSLHSARLAMRNHLLTGSSASPCSCQNSRSGLREMTCMSPGRPPGHGLATIGVNPEAGQVKGNTSSLGIGASGRLQRPAGSPSEPRRPGVRPAPTGGPPSRRPGRPGRPSDSPSRGAAGGRTRRGRGRARFLVFGPGPPGPDPRGHPGRSRPGPIAHPSRPAILATKFSW